MIMAAILDASIFFANERTWPKDASYAFLAQFSIDTNPKIHLSGIGLIFFSVI